MVLKFLKKIKRRKQEIQFQRISCEEARSLLCEKHVLIIDVRDEDDRIEKPFPQAVPVDKYAFNDFVATTDKNTPILVCCLRGRRSRVISRRLIDKGFKEIYSLEGGIEAWSK